MTRVNYGGARRNRLEGTTVGHWSVLEYLSAGKYRCRCVCATERTLPTQSLIRRSSRSCGCKSAEITRERKAEATTKQAFKPREKFE